MDKLCSPDCDGKTRWRYDYDESFMAEDGFREPAVIDYAGVPTPKPQFIPPPKWHRIFSLVLCAASVLLYLVVWASLGYAFLVQDASDTPFTIAVFCALAEGIVAIICLVWIPIIVVIPLGTRSKGVSKINALLSCASLALCLHGFWQTMTIFAKGLR